MAAVQVLSQRNCLKKPSTSRQASLSPLLKYLPKPKPNPNVDPSTNPNQAISDQSNRQTKRRSSRFNNTNSLPANTAVQKLTAANNKLSGDVSDVKIIKRGKKVTKPGEQHQPSTTPKEKRRSRKKIQEHKFYTACSVVPPPPSSLPMPTFIAKQRGESTTDDEQEPIADPTL